MPSPRRSPLLRPAGPGRPASRGHATVEQIAVVVLVALLLTAVSAWAAREMRPPERPPDVIEVAAAPLQPGAHPFRAGRLTWYVPPQRVSIFGRALRATGRFIVEAGTVGYVFGRAFVRRLGHRIEHYVRNPEAFVTDMLGSLESLARDPIGHLGPNQVRAVRDYVARLRRLSPREAAHRLAEDAGAFAADLVIDYTTRAAARRIIGRARLPPAPPPSPMAAAGP